MEGTEGPLDRAGQAVAGGTGVGRREIEDGQARNAGEGTRSERVGRQPVVTTLSFLLVVVAWLSSIAISIGFIVFLSRDRANTQADAAIISGQLVLAEQKLATYQAADECDRQLSITVQARVVDELIESDRYVIGLGVGGDITTLKANLEVAAKALEVARDAYVAQVCPTGS